MILNPADRVHNHVGLGRTPVGTNVRPRLMSLIRTSATAEAFFFQAVGVYGLADKFRCLVFLTYVSCMKILYCCVLFISCDVFLLLNFYYSSKVQFMF